MAKYYYYEGDQVKGPVAVSVIRDLYYDGIIAKNTKIMEDGNNQWCEMWQAFPDSAALSSESYDKTSNFISNIILSLYILSSVLTLAFVAICVKNSDYYILIWGSACVVLLLSVVAILRFLLIAINFIRDAKRYLAD